MNPEKGHIRIAAVVLALIVVVAVVAVIAMPRDVSVEKEGDGTLSFEGEKSLRAFGSLEIEIEPGDGCVAKVYLDGDEVASGVTSYKYNAPFADFSKHEIKVVFEPSAPTPSDKVTLTVEKGEGGSVDPNGAKEVAKGSTQTIRIIPDDGYVIDGITIDGKAVTVCNVLDVEMDADHIVSIAFRPADAQDTTVTIDVDAQIEIRTTGGDVDFGKVVPSGEMRVKPGSSLKITVMLNPGFEMKDFEIDGKSVGKVTEYTIEDIQKSVDVSISVVKQVDGYTITATAGNGGKITPSGETRVEKGKDATFTFTADSGYAISEVTVDGQKVSATGSYTFKNVTSNHMISVSFKYTGGVTPSKTLTKIEITKQPTKTAYISGESFDASGMVVMATYSDGTTRTVTDYTYSPAEALTSSMKSVTISYGGKTCTQAIDVYDLESISADAKDCRMGYLVGESFDKTGLVVTAKYGSIERILDEDDYECSPSGPFETAGDVTITITFQEKSCTVVITVVEQSTLTGIEITKGPTKNHYFDDQEFVNDGMVVSGVYSGGTTIPLNIEDVTISESNGTVTATYTMDSNTYTTTWKAIRDYEIRDVPELKYFRDKVNDGKDYSGKRITLLTDVDLDNELWTPIGSSADGSNKFRGTFDGNGHTISNLKIDTFSDKKYQATGFFGALNGTVLNLTFKNATIDGFSEGNDGGNTDNGIAVVAGSIYNSGSIEKVRVQGATITGNRYIGAISGYVYGIISDCSVSDVIVVATPNPVGSKYDNGDKVGGIAGYLGEGKYSITNCSVSDSSISGYRNLGGIVGAAHQAPESCKVENITILHTRDVISDEPSNGNQSGVIAGTRVGTAAPTSNTVSGTVTTDDVGVLSSACAYAGSSTVTIELMDGTYTPLSKKMTVSSGKDIVIQPATDQDKVVFDGQAFVTGKLTVHSIQMNTAYEIDEISQFKWSGVAVQNEGQFIADDVTFRPTLNDSTAITAYWSSGKGSQITVTNCKFDCGGNRPIRSDCSVTVENCTFNDQYRYSVQLTSKAGTVTDIDKASVVFKNNTINAGSTISNPVYGVQLEGNNYGCSDLVIEGSGNTIDYGTTGKTGAMYYCDCGIVDHDTITWNTEVDPIHKSYNYIMTVDDLKKLAADVNGGQSYNGVTFALGADIDLYGVDWTPIGSATHVFEGIFDGQGHTISNLNIDKSGWNDVGLFGVTNNGEIRNLIVENATVKGYLDVGVVAGTPYTSKYTNITVKGDIVVEGYAYVGGVGGKNAYADWTNITVVAGESSYVKADSKGYRTYVGGVIGFMGEGNQVMTNLTSNIDVIGSTCDVGGITGIAHYGNKFINCSSSGDVTLVNATDDGDQLEIGGIAGTWLNSDSGDVSIINCSYTGKLSSKLNGVPVEDGYYPYAGLIGYKYNRNSDNGKLIIEMEGFTDAVFVGTADELLKVANGLSENQSDYKDKTIVLMNNMDMTGKEWPYIKLDNKVGGLKFIGYGEGITISNLKLSSTTVDGNTSSVGFISCTGSMKSLSFEKMTLKGLDTGDIKDSGVNAVGAFIGYAGTSEAITITNCEVVDGKISGGHWTGGFVGYAAGYSEQGNGPVFEVLTIENCTISNSTVTSPGSAGGIIGHATGDAWTRDVIKKCYVTGCTIFSTGTSNDKAGSLMGTVGAGQSKAGKDGGVFVDSCNVENTYVKSNGTTIDRIYGRQGTTGGVLCVDGEYVFFKVTDLEKAIDQGVETIRLPSRNYNLPTNLDGKTVTFIGQSKDDTVLNVPSQLIGVKNVAFENITLKKANADYQGFNSSESATFKNCVIEGQFFLYGPSVVFNGCTFKQTDSNSYNVWTYGGLNVTFSDCRFDCAGKAVLVYNEGAVHDAKISFNNCVFNNSSEPAGKSAVEIDTRFSEFDVKINKCTLEGSWSEGTVSGQKLWNNKAGNALTITIDGVKADIKKVGFVYGETDGTSPQYLEASKMSTVLKNKSIEAIVFSSSDTWDLSAFKGDEYKDVVFEISGDKTPTLKNIPTGWTYRFYGEGYTGYGILNSQTQYKQGGYFEVSSADGFINVNKDYDAINEKLQAFMPYKNNLQYLWTYNVKLVADLDFENRTMDTIEFRYASIDGRNGDSVYTVKNANMDAVHVQRDSVNKNFGGFVTSVGSISNISFDNIHITCDLSDALVGVVAGYSAGNAENVHVSNSSISINAKGCYAGGLFGDSYAHMKNCSIDTVTISGGKNVGSLAGYVAHEDSANTQEISNNSVSNVTMNSTEREKTVNAFCGRINADKGAIAISGTKISNITVNGVTYDQKDLVQTADKTPYGQIYTGTITIDGTAAPLSDQ